jgi:hypothetical protein
MSDPKNARTRAARLDPPCFVPLARLAVVGPGRAGGYAPAFPILRNVKQIFCPDCDSSHPLIGRAAATRPGRIRLHRSGLLTLPVPHCDNSRCCGSASQRRSRPDFTFHCWPQQLTTITACGSHHDIFAEFECPQGRKKKLFRQQRDCRGTTLDRFLRLQGTDQRPTEYNCDSSGYLLNHRDIKL